MTIREIAALAGVSRSTVSLVLNESPLVRKETREKVLRVIHDTGYVPNASARSLNWKSTRCLGIIVLSDQQRGRDYDFSMPIGLFSLNVMRGITECLAESPYSVFVEYYSYDYKETEKGKAQTIRLPRLIRERKIDGAFLVGGFCTEELLNAAASTGIPLITVGVGAETPLCDSVISDPAQGTYDGLMRLYESGRRNPVLLNCPRVFRSAAMREEGMRRFCKETSLPFSMENVICCSHHNNGENAYEAVKSAWESGIRFDSLITANPGLALGAMRFFAEKQLRVPQDISIVAYEDNAMCGYVTPPLTAVNIQKERMGEEAAGLMLRRLSEPEMKNQLVIVPSYLVERASV